jgi:hypothetical protein
VNPERQNPRLRTNGGIVIDSYHKEHYNKQFIMRRQIIHLFMYFILFGQLIVAADGFRFTENDKKQLILTEGTLPVLTYQYDVIEHENVPQRDRRRTAGCYVHPLHGINGEVLTDNAPRDHYHHHGVFWTWPHVGVHESDGTVKQYDLWTSDGTLKQHFVRWINKTITEQSATFEVENGWFIGDPKDSNKIMIERVKIIVHRIQKPDDPTNDIANNIASRAIDFEFQWQPTSWPITLRGAEDKSYGGFTIRFKPVVADGKREAERSDVNRITVPTGVAEGDLSEMPLAWADYTSQFDNRTSGAAVFIPRTHPDYPPTWLTRYYGPLCVGYPGVKGKTFQIGEKLELRYRIWIHDSGVTAPQIEKAYEEYITGGGDAR